MSPGVMPSSIASLASGGGASAAAVASSSATNISVDARRGRGAAARPARAACARARVASPRRRRRRSSQAAPGPMRAGALTAPPPRVSTGLRGEEDLVGQALLDDLAVERRMSSSSSSCVPRAAIAAALEHDDLVGQRDRREAVGDHERRAALHHLAQRRLISCSVEASTERGGVVEDQDARVGEQRARDRDPLALAAGERQAALADERVVAVGQLVDEAVGLRAPRRLLDLLARRVGPRVGDVVVHGGGEEERVVGDDARSRGAARPGRRRARRRRRSRTAPASAS